MLKKGSRGTEVKKLQEQLNKLGYNCGKADGIFGDKTYHAVIRF
ncbi:MAG: peptidoglycan-binding domain-containing protein [Caldicoprobacterales bacterium]